MDRWLLDWTLGLTNLEIGPLAMDTSAREARVIAGVMACQHCCTIGPLKCQSNLICNKNKRCLCDVSTRSDGIGPLQFCGTSFGSIGGPMIMNLSLNWPVIGLVILNQFDTFLDAKTACVLMKIIDGCSRIGWAQPPQDTPGLLWWKNKPLFK